MNAEVQKTLDAKNRDKNKTPLRKFMNKAVYGKTMENLRNRIDVKLVSNKKDFLKRTSKPSYMSHKIFGNYVVTIVTKLD